MFLLFFFCSKVHVQSVKDVNKDVEKKEDGFGDVIENQHKNEEIRSTNEVLRDKEN